MAINNVRGALKQTGNTLTLNDGGNTTAITGGAPSGDIAITLPAVADTLVGKATTDTLTNKSIDQDGTGNSITNLANASISDAAGIDLDKLAAITPSVVPVGDASGFLVASAVTAAELGYVAGLTSAVQTQLNAKLDDLASTTDNALVRTSGTVGGVVQDSGIIIDNDDNMSGIGTVGCGTITIGGDADLSRDSAGVLRTSGDLIVDGSIMASGTLTYLKTTNLVIKDNLIEVNDGAVTAPANNTAGLAVARGGSSFGYLVWHDDEDTFSVGSGVTTANVRLLLDASNSTTVTNKIMTRIANSFTRTVTTYSSSDTLAVDTDDVVLASGTISLNLPAASSNNGVEFTIKKTDSNATTITIDPSGAETIDGAATYTLTEQYVGVTIVCDGTSWSII